MSEMTATIETCTGCGHGKQFFDGVKCKTLVNYGDSFEQQSGRGFAIVQCGHRCSGIPNGEHEIIQPGEPHDCHREENCPVCDGGLAVCRRCGEYEAGLENPCLMPQPEPDAGEEWRALAGPAAFAAVVDKDGREVARCYRHADTKWAEDHAMQIVTDHTRAALVPKLVEALEGERKHLTETIGKHRDKTRSVQSIPCSPDWCVACERFEARLEIIDAALALVKGR